MATHDPHAGLETVHLMTILGVVDDLRVFARFPMLSRKCASAMRRLKTNPGLFVREYATSEQINKKHFLRELELFPAIETVKTTPALISLPNVVSFLKMKLLALYFCNESQIPVINAFADSLRFLSIHNIEPDGLDMIEWHRLASLQTLKTTHCVFTPLMIDAIVGYPHFHRLVATATQEELLASLPHIKRLRANSIETIVIARIVQATEPVSTVLRPWVDAIEMNAMMRLRFDATTIPAEWRVIDWTRINFPLHAFVGAESIAETQTQLARYALNSLSIDGRLPTPPVTELSLLSFALVFVCLRNVRLETVYLPSSVRKLKIEEASITALDVGETPLRDIYLSRLVTAKLVLPSTVTDLWVTELDTEVLVLDALPLASHLLRGLSVRVLTVANIPAITLINAQIREAAQLSGVVSLAVVGMTCPLVTLPATLTSVSLSGSINATFAGVAATLLPRKQQKALLRLKFAV